MAIKRKRRLKFSDVQTLDLRKAPMGKLIRFHRLRQNMSMTQVAGKMGLSDGYLSAIEAGKVDTSLRHLSQLCEILKVRKDDIWR